MPGIAPVIGIRWRRGGGRFMIPPMRLLLTMLLLAGCTAAQNSDLAVLVGISGPKGQVTNAAGVQTVSGSVTPSYQVNYAWQVLQRAVDLYVELPLVIPVRVTGIVAAGPGVAAEAANSSPDVFFTPGARVKFSPEARVSFYAAAGAGIASFAATPSLVAPLTVVAGSRQTSFALGIGGGVDFRLTRLLRPAGGGARLCDRRRVGRRHREKPRHPPGRNRVPLLKLLRNPTAGRRGSRRSKSPSRPGCTGRLCQPR